MNNEDIVSVSLYEAPRTRPSKWTWTIVLICLGLAALLVCLGQSSLLDSSTPDDNWSQSEPLRVQSGATGFTLLPAQLPTMSNLTVKAIPRANLFICDPATHNVYGTASIRTTGGVILGTPMQLDGLRPGGFYSIALLRVTVPAGSPALVVNDTVVGTGTWLLAGAWQASEPDATAPRCGG